MKQGNIISAVCLILLSAFIWYETSDFPANIIPGVPAPEFFPRMIALILFFLSFLLILASRSEKETVSLFNFQSKGMRRALLVLAVTIAYSMFLSYAGFLLLTPLCLLILMLIMEKGKVLQKLVVAVITTAVIYGLFELMLDVPLPQIAL